MNDLFAGSSAEHRIEMNPVPTVAGAGEGVVNLDKFFADVESIKNDLFEIDNIYRRLHDCNEQSKTLHNAKAVKDLRSRMDSEVLNALKKVKVVKVRIEALDRSNASSRSLPGCGPGTSSDRQRTSIVNGLRNKLVEAMNSFNNLREQISSEYRETVQRRYFTVTGENPDEKTLDVLISTGESETFLQKAISEQGRGQVMDTISEIQERHEGVKEMEKNLKELHQVFLDMAVLVEAQGEQLNDIESHVARASSFIRGGAEQLVTARVYQKSSRKWMCYGIIIVIVVVLLLVLFIVKPWQKSG